MVNVGILGLGFMAVTHLRAYRQVPGARIVAVCNPSGRHLDGSFDDVAGNVGTADPVRLDMAQVRGYRDVSQFLSDPEIQLVDICSPTAAHHDHVLAAFAAGKHVICEKPLARTSAEARALADAALRHDRILLPAMCLRFWPEWSLLKDSVRDQRHGKLLAARFRRVAEAPAWGQSHFKDGSRSGGALLDLHIHDTDYVQFLFGRPKAVFSTGFSRVSGAIDHVVTQYLVEGGATVHAEGSWAMTPGFGFNMAYTAIFEQATLDFDLARGADALKLFRAGTPPEILKLGQPDGYVHELREAVDAVARGIRPVTVTPEEGAQAVEICEAEERSVRSGRIESL